MYPGCLEVDSVLNLVGVLVLPQGIAYPPIPTQTTISQAERSCRMDLEDGFSCSMAYFYICTVHTHTYIYICTYIYIYTHTHIYIYIHTYIICLCMYMYMYMIAYGHVYHVYVYVYTYYWTFEIVWLFSRVHLKLQVGKSKRNCHMDAVRKGNCMGLQLLGWRMMTPVWICSALMHGMTRG